jgi:hypothetical protein
MRKAMPLVVLLLPLSRAEAAPAPLPKPEAFAEVIFEARDPEQAREVAAFLRSPYLARWARSNDRAGQALPRLDDAEFLDWSKANLSVKQEGVLVRVRLRGGRSLANLQALTEALAGRRTKPTRVQEREREIRFLELALLSERHRKDKEGAQALRGWCEVEARPLKVQTAPRAFRVRR